MSKALSTRFAAVLLTASLLAFGLTLLPGPWLPRFTYAPLNYWFAGVSAAAIPAALLALGLAVRSLWLGVALILLALASAIPLTPFAFVAFLAAPDQADPEHSNLVKIDEASTQQYRYRLYRTDCGATCAYGLELRKEVDMFRFAKLVSPLWSATREDSAVLRLTATGEVQVVNGERILYTHGK